MRILLVIMSLVALLQAPLIFADSHTNLLIQKTTTLTGPDAKEFIKTFGSTYRGDARFNFECHESKCHIFSTVSGFKGELAKKLLGQKKHAHFRSKNHTFKLHCKNGRVSYCNVIQKNAVLKDKPQQLAFDIKRLVASLPGNVCWKDRHGVYLGGNKAFLKALGMKSEAELIGKTDYDLLTKEKADKIVANDQEVMSQKAIKTYKEDAIDSEGHGTPATYISKKVPYFDDKGNVIGMLCVAFDVTHLG